MSPGTTGRIIALTRYPVKSMGGERLDGASVTAAGIDGDRRWGVLNVATGRLLTARREPRLLFASARVLDGGVELMLPQGASVAAGSTDPHGADAALSAWLGYDVRLLDSAQGHGRQTMEIASNFEDETGSEWVSWQGPDWSFHDSTRTAVSVLSTGSIGMWDDRRFRANIVIERDTERDLVGRLLSAGSAVLDAGKHIDRCVMVTRPQPGRAGAVALERDLDVLRSINAHHNGELGVGCLVTTPGQVHLGDDIAVIG